MFSCRLNTNLKFMVAVLSIYKETSLMKWIVVCCYQPISQNKRYIVRNGMPELVRVSQEDFFLISCFVDVIKMQVSNWDPNFLIIHIRYLQIPLHWSRARFFLHGPRFFFHKQLCPLDIKHMRYEVCDLLVLLVHYNWMIVMARH